MNSPRSRPTVTITTYSANNSSYFRHPSLKSKQPPQGGGEGGQPDEGEHATKCEFSTNFFRNNLRQLNSIVSDKPRSHHHQQIIGGNLGGITARARASAAGTCGVLADLSQIRGPTGSVRGHKDVVRKSLEGIKVTYHNRFMQFPASSSIVSSSSASSSSSSTSSSSGGSSLLSFSTFFAGHHHHHQQSARQNLSVNSNQSSLTSFSGPTIAKNNSKSRPSVTNSSLLTIDNELYCSEYLERLIENEQNLCVAYTTTLGVIRRTFEDSKQLRSILDLNLVKYEERDIYLNQEYKFQLKMRSGSIVVPALFVDGVHIGGAKELETLNENGELQKLLAQFKMSKASKEICSCCGNARFIACQSCNGSRKSTIHHFKFNSIALRCIKCDNNDGLIQCPLCCGGVIRDSSSTSCGSEAASSTRPEQTTKVDSARGLEVKEQDVTDPKPIIERNENLKLELDINNNSNSGVEC